MIPHFGYADFVAWNLAGLRKSTVADFLPPDMEAEIMAIAPELLPRLAVRAANIGAKLRLHQIKQRVRT